MNRLRVIIDWHHENDNSLEEPVLNSIRGMYIRGDNLKSLNRTVRWVAKFGVGF